MGLIDSVNTLYLPQIVVDAEIVAMIRRLLGQVEFTHETIARETIERVGIGGNFLKEKETKRRIRAGEHFIPRVASRLPYDAWQARARRARRGRRARRRSSPPEPSAALTSAATS